MTEDVNRQILLVEKPSGRLGLEHFRLVESAMPTPKDGEVLVRVTYISLDAANRAWMHGATYRPALEDKAVMAGGGVAEVMESKARGFAAGDLVFGDTGWQDDVVLPAKELHIDGYNQRAKPFAWKAAKVHQKHLGTRVTYP